MIPGKHWQSTAAVLLPSWHPVASDFKPHTLPGRTVVIQFPMYIHANKSEKITDATAG